MARKNGEFKIMSFNVSDTKNGDTMAKLQLKDTMTEEIINCVIWQDFLAKIDKRALRVGNIISIIESEYNEKFHNEKIKQVKLIKEAIAGLSLAEREDVFKKILDIVNSFKDENMKNAILKVISADENLFKTSPAARTHHHNYVGGLMQHIMECVDFAKALFPVIPLDINHELILAGCVAHDLGKMYEYIIDVESGVVERDKDWEAVWINHIYWGFGWANQNGLPELAHIISSHHGIKDYGALVEPATREAELFHSLDYMSSTVGKLSVEELERV